MADPNSDLDSSGQGEPLLPKAIETSICTSCNRHRIIVSGKGSVFLLCQLESPPNNWPKYPRQPVGSCHYFSEKVQEMNGN